MREIECQPLKGPKGALRGRERVAELMDSDGINFVRERRDDGEGAEEKGFLEHRSPWGD